MKTLTVYRPVEDEVYEWFRDNLETPVTIDRQGSIEVPGHGELFWYIESINYGEDDSDAEIRVEKLDGTIWIVEVTW